MTVTTIQTMPFADRIRLSRFMKSLRFTLAAAWLFVACDAWAEDARREEEPPFPRIGNCYGAGLGYRSWEEGGAYWSKLGLIVGGCYDLHYDWDSRDWSKALAKTEANLARLREVNPKVIVLPYVDVIEGIDHPSIPAAWWDLNAESKRWQGWPGYYRINTKLPEVLDYNLTKVRDNILKRPCFDGVFYDCWHVEDTLCPKTAALRDGRAVVMINDWNLPNNGFATLNGCLAEDEFNRVMEGKADFEDFLARYLRWCRESRKPAVTMLVGHPRKMPMDAFANHQMPWKQRVELRKSLQNSDPQALRFGLATTLMGDGYFGYDSANMGRGDWWWFPEYDAPLGHPKGPAHREADGIWRREFDGGLVVVNGTSYDTTFRLASNHRDVSSDRVAKEFTLRMFDGRILLPTKDAPRGGDDPPARLTAEPVTQVVAATLDEGMQAVKTPGGLELRVSHAGELQSILWRGKRLFQGGWPSAKNAEGKALEVEKSETPEVHVSDKDASLAFRGVLRLGSASIGYEETLVAGADNSFILDFQFTAKTEVKAKFWRHYFMLPVSSFRGAQASNTHRELVLPEVLGKEDLLPGDTKVTLKRAQQTIALESSTPMSVVDHRKWGTDDYLLSAYPVRGDVKADATWSYRVKVTVSEKPE